MNTYVKHSKKPKLYFITRHGELVLNKKAMAAVVKGRKKQLPRLNKVWVEGKGLVDS